MEYCSTISFKSEYDPSITVVIRKPSYGERLDLDERTQGYRTTLRNIGRRSATLDKQVAPDKRKFESEKAARLRTLRAGLPTAPEPLSRPELDAQIAEVQASAFEEPVDVAFERDEIMAEMLQAVARDYNPILIRWGVIEIRGLVLTGKPAYAEGAGPIDVAYEAGVDELLAAGPIDLVYEIKDRIEQVMGMKGEELKNSSLPSISSAPADGKTNDTSASAAASPDCTKPETADSPKPTSLTQATS